MKKSESIKELATALAKAQGALDAAKKDVENSFFKSKYADLSSVVDALKACFPAHGLSYVQTVVTEDHGVGVETMLMHESGEWIMGEPFYIPVNKADAQGFGSAMTYARRYSLSAIAGVKADDDDGNAAAKAKPAAKETPILPAPIPANVEGQDIYNAYTAEQKAIVDEWCDELRAMVSGGDLAGALDRAKEMAPDSDQEGQLVLAYRMDSTTRNKMKAEKKRRNQPHLAEQA